MKLTILFVSMALGFSASVSAGTLQETVDTAIKTNPDVLGATSTRNAVAEEIKQARAGYFPTADLGLGTGWEESNNPLTRGLGKDHESLNRNEASLNIRQMLFDGMETKSEVARQTSREEASGFTLYSAAENTGLEAAREHLNVLERQKIVGLAEDNLEAHQKTHDQIKLRSERGVNRKADVQQSLGRLALAETNLLSEKGNLIDAETTYLRVVNVMPASLVDPESPQSLLPGSLEEAISTGIDNHPTLKSANSDIDAANAQHDVTESPFWPRVDFELGTRNDNDIGGLEGTNESLQAMLRLRYNLLNGGADKARRQETAYLINQATEVRNNTHRQVEQSVRLSWNAYETVTKQLQYLQQHVDSSEKARDAYRQQFSIGQRTLLDLLDSENEVFTARIALVEGQYDQVFAIYRVLNSTGGLMTSLGVSLPDAEQTQLSENTTE